MKSSIAKVDTNKCIICYFKDSDSKPYVQVLTVSGTTITTNTPVIMKNSGNLHRTSMTQISAGRVIIMYTDNSTGSLFARTIDISGTTPTVNTESGALDTTGGTWYM